MHPPTRGNAAVQARDPRDWFFAAAAGFVELVAQVSPDQWESHGIGVWTIRDLVGHTSRALSTVVVGLDAGLEAVGDDNLPAGVDTLGYYRHVAAAADHDQVAERGREAGRSLGERPADAVAELAATVRSRLDGTPDNAPVVSRFATMTLIDYLPTRAFELTVHSLDLVSAARLTPPAGTLRGIGPALHLATDIGVTRGDGIPLLRAITGRGSLEPGYSVL